MRWCSVVVCCLLAGSISAQQSIVGDAGKEVTFNLITFSENVTSCHLTTPAEETLNFFPEKPSEKDERYELKPINAGLFASCSVIVRNLEDTDNGIWEVAYRDGNGEGTSTKFNLTVTPRVVDDKHIVNVTWLSPIEFPTRTGQNIDISLSKKPYPEHCYIRKPGGYNVTIADANIEGVTVHHSSDFVSCRVTIGPMNASMLGDWTLCGKRADNSEEQDRCQLVKITWQNNASPNAHWSTSIQSKFNHVVNFGGTLTPVVLGYGRRMTCHIITPNGEDLVIAADSEYPNLSLVPSDSSACRIAIGPIAASLLGDWTLYGKFRDITGMYEARLPMNLFLYDENNPYDQAYNVTIRDAVKRVVNLGSTLNIEVTGIGKVDNCQFKTPSGEIVDLESPGYEGVTFVDVRESTTCRIAIGPLAEQLLGNWTITGKFSNNDRFMEEQRTFEVLEEDPSNPLIDEGRVVQNMTAQRVNTEIGKSHKLLIHTNFLITGQSCHIRTPDGLQYSIIDGFKVPGVEVIEEVGVECGVIVHVLSEDAVGTWTLIARAMQSSQPIERRLPFTIIVEEPVDAIPKEVTILEGNDLHIRLATPTEQYDTCKLVAPTGAVSSHVADPLHVQSCGYIITNITTSDYGPWRIIYGSRATYIATVVVVVTDSSGYDTDFLITIELIRDRPVNKTIGSESAIYCRLEDPKGNVVFDGFGRCTLAVDKVTLSHQGLWRMSVGLPGKVVAVEHLVEVNVKERESKPLLSTHVTYEKTMATVSCSVATEAAVRTCKFRDPHGRILLASAGVAEDRYVFHGTDTSYQSEVRIHECGLQIRNPQVIELGHWRCAIDTEEDTYYGFLTLRNSSFASPIQQGPTLKSDRVWIVDLEDEPVTMSCAVNAAIRYCYFRAPNGTTYAVSPGLHSQSHPVTTTEIKLVETWGKIGLTTANLEYVGAGFDAGECGIRFRGMYQRDSGRWGCHVNLATDHVEQHDQFQLNIHEAMSVRHSYGEGSSIFVEGQVYENRALEYCRFLRNDGFGFSTDNIPFEYTNSSSLAHGNCRLTIRHPTLLDRHPWTVVAKVRGQNTEISRDTIGMMNGPTAVRQTGMSIFFYVLMVSLLISIILGACLGPKKSREWTYARYSSVRRSVQSFRKQPLTPPVNQHI